MNLYSSGVNVEFGQISNLPFSFPVKMNNAAKRADCWFGAKRASPGPVAVAVSADSDAYAYYSPSVLAPRSQFVAEGD
ncbi:hypothetical protein L484_009404 [Morus notabilis]|uniref:Uncharacterized protein n=1 Tax=Morus notabilis TaxID=981085 RepID=W9RJJ6_9ROSA|nr:hypothetical protein L484_009404 [Morus notabilis]